MKMKKLRGYLYESWDGITNGTGQKMRPGDYGHFFTNLLLSFYGVGTFFILSRLSGILLVQDGMIPA